MSYSVYEHLMVLRCYEGRKYGHKAIHYRPKVQNCKCTNCQYAHEVVHVAHEVVFRMKYLLVIQCQTKILPHISKLLTNQKPIKKQDTVYIATKISAEQHKQINYIDYLYQYTGNYIAYCRIKSDNGRDNH